MKLYERRFVRALKQDVRREVKSRLEWREIVRRRRWAWLSTSFNITTLRWIVPFLFANLGFIGAGKDTLWMVFGLWAVVMAALRASQFQTFHSRGGGIMPFISLPVSTKQVFDHGNARIFRASLWLLVDLLGALSVCALREEAPMRVWLGAIPSALILWLSALSLAVFLLWRFPRVPYGVYAAGFLALVVIGSIAAARLQLDLSAILPGVGAFVFWATPPGWANQVGMWLTGHAASFPGAAAGLLIIWLALTVRWYGAVASRYAFWQWDDPTPAPPRVEATPKEELAAAPGTDGQVPKVASPPNEKAIQAEAELRTGAFLRPFFDQASPSLRANWVERLITGRFRQQAALVDFMIGKPPRWSRHYAIALILLVIGAAMAEGLSVASFEPETWITWLLPGVALCLVTPVLGGHWPGFYLGALQQRNIAVMAILPIDLRTASRLVRSINLLRFLLALPCWLLVGALAAHIMHVDLDVALRVTMEFWLLTLAVQPVMIVCKYSMGTNDTGRWYIALGVAAFCAVMVAGLVGAITAIFSGTLLWQIITLAAVAAISTAFSALYQRMYVGRHFDLLAKRPPASTLTSAD